MTEDTQQLDAMVDEALNFSALGEISLENKRWDEAIKNYTLAITKLETAYNYLEQSTVKKTLYSRYEKILLKKIKQYRTQIDRVKLEIDKENKLKSIELLEKKKKREEKDKFLSS